MILRCFVARVLTAFYCEKLDDIDTVIPAFKGILSLSFLPHFVGSDAVETFNASVNKLSHHFVKADRNIQIGRARQNEILCPICSLHCLQNY